MSYTLSRSKFDHLQACATPSGVIAALAMDQRGSLRRALEAVQGGDFTDAQLSEFKGVVTETLTPHASALLIDPQFGLEASKRRAPGSGLLFAYERSGYDNAKPGRLPDLEPAWSVRRLAEAGADGVKLLVYYNPFDEGAINDRKHAFVERVGAECAAVGLPLFLEPLTYDDALPDEVAFAEKQPAYVNATIAEFSKARYLVDVLKVELPMPGAYVDGLSAPPKAPLYGRAQAVQHLQEAASLAQKPFIYLSAGVDMALFAELLTLAGEEGVPFNGVLCGRATWKGGIPIYAREGAAATRTFLAREGAANIERLNRVLERYARPWWDAFGGRDALEIEG